VSTVTQEVVNESTPGLSVDTICLHYAAPTGRRAIIRAGPGQRSLPEGWRSSASPTLLPPSPISGQCAGTLARLLAGGSAILVERFSVAEFWDDARRRGITQTTLRKIVTASVTQRGEQITTRFGVLLTDVTTLRSARRMRTANKSTRAC